MKADELRACDCCHKGLMAEGHVSFHRITFERFGIDLRAVRERAGLHMMGLTGGLSETFASRGEVAVRIGSADQLIICERCALEPAMPMQLSEIAAARVAATTCICKPVTGNLPHLAPMQIVDPDCPVHKVITIGAQSLDFPA